MQNIANATYLESIIANKLLDKTAVVKAEPSAILDLGAGNGTLSDMLVNQYPNTKITALDISNAKCDFLAKNPNFKTICADARNMPFSDWSYSAIYSNLMLQWIPDYQKVFPEVKRILAPGGFFIFSTFGPETLHEMRTAWSVVDDYKHVNEFPAMQIIADDLAQQGFIDVVVSTENIVIRYDSIRTILKDLQEMGASNISALNKYKGLMTKSKLAKFCKKYEEFKLDDGSYPVTYQVVYAICWAKDKTTSDAKEHLVSVDHLRNIMRRFQENVTD